MKQTLGDTTVTWLPQTIIALLALGLSGVAFRRTTNLLARSDVTDAVTRWHALFDQRNMTVVAARLRNQGSSLAGTNQWQFASPQSADQTQNDFGAVVSMLDAALPIVALANQHKSTWKKLGPHMLERLQKLITSVDELRWEASKAQDSWEALTVNDRLEQEFIGAIQALNGFNTVFDHVNEGKGLDPVHPNPRESNSHRW